MKASQTIATFLIAVILLGANIAIAASPTVPTGGGTGATITNPLRATSIQCLVVNILNLVSSIGAIVVALMIIYTGYKFVVARGNEKEITDAKRALLYTLIGALILLGAVVIANAIAGTLNQVLQSGASVPTLNTSVCR